MTAIDTIEAPEIDLGDRVVKNIQRQIELSGINDNIFYREFRSRVFSAAELKTVFQQYYYYIRTFPQILSGLAARVDNERIRMKLARTVVSELGDNGQGEAHFKMFEDVLSAVGVTLDDWRTADYAPETAALVSGLERIFLAGDCNAALGAHYVIEEFGFPMIVALYEGFRNYSGWKHEEYMYFYLHLLIECNHVDWIGDAVREAAIDEAAAASAESGAQGVLSLLQSFWSGLHRIAMDAVSDTVKC